MRVRLYINIAVLKIAYTEHIHRDPKICSPLTHCHIALLFHSVFSQKSTKCLRKLWAVNSNLIRLPPAASVRTLLCNVDVKIMLLRSAHRAHDSFLEKLTKEAPDFIPPTLWPLNSPDLNPVNYKIWLLMQEKVYKHHVKDVSELREHIVAAWDELDQGIIDTSVGQWRTCLRSCVKALSGHFKHKLWLVISH